MQLSQPELKRFRSFATALFGKKPLVLGIPIDFIPHKGECLIRTERHGLSIAYRAAIEPTDESLSEPIRLSAKEFDRLPQDNGPIEFSPIESTENGSRFTVAWHRNAIRQAIECDLVSPESAATPDQDLSPVDGSFLEALREVSKTTDDESQRYALSCLQFDGKAGTVTATDGRQLLRIGGFDLPWKDQTFFLQGNKLFRLNDFCKLNKVRIGLNNEKLVIQADRWRFEFPMVREARFPNIDRVIPNPRNTSNRVRIEERDRDFLIDALPRLPGDTDVYKPVTLDLNGHVAVVGHSPSGPQDNTAVILDRSIHLGPDLRASFDRTLLKRAMELGAEELYITPEGPLLASSKNLQYVCMSLDNQPAEIAWDSIQQIHSRPTTRA
jgi:hypothetical protein